MIAITHKDENCITSLASTVIIEVSNSHYTRVKYYDTALKFGGSN